MVQRRTPCHEVQPLQAGGHLQHILEPEGAENRVGLPVFDPEHAVPRPGRERQPRAPAHGHGHAMDALRCLAAPTTADGRSILAAVGVRGCKRTTTALAADWSGCTARPCGSYLGQKYCSLAG